jgi:methionyl-tRNA formyltransferase
MRLVFAGTPEVAVPSLDALLASQHTVAAVVTRPDAPAGRGLRMMASPVAERARQAGLEVLQPGRPSDAGFLARLGELAPDCCPVTAYGALIPSAALGIPGRGWVNLHFSLLPAWRGAAPVQHAILHGDEITGATTFLLVPELDAGPVFGMVTEVVKPSDTAGDLLARLAVSGADLLVATMDGIEAGELEARPQPRDGISLAPKIGRADARVNWTRPAQAVDRQIRACTPAPGAWTALDGVIVRVGPVALLGNEDAGQEVMKPGEVAQRRGRALVGTGTVPVGLGQVQPAGKRMMTAAEWLRGVRNSQVVLV